MKVTEVSENVREADINGPMSIYKLKVEKRGGEVIVAELLKRPTSPKPAVGDVLNVAEVKPGKGEFPPTLRLEKPQGQFGGGGGPRGKSPEEQRSIARQVAAKLAMEQVAPAYAELSDEQYAAEFNRLGELYYDFIAKP
jgi:hypothetical protein